jgi:hypothetical protein
LDYLATHGGLDAAGQPITELTFLGDSIYRQCFVNLCLEERRNEKGALRVRPVPLGYAYLERGRGSALPSAMQPASQPSQSELQAPGSQPDMESSDDQAQEFRVDAWERLPTVAQNQSQEITVSVFKNNVPVSLAEPLLVLSLPDENYTSYYMLPTGEDGTSYLKLDPIDVENGTLIPYQVCLYDLGGQDKCVEDSFMVWGEP